MDAKNFHDMHRSAFSGGTDSAWRRNAERNQSRAGEPALDRAGVLICKHLRSQYVISGHGRLAWCSDLVLSFRPGQPRPCRWATRPRHSAARREGEGMAITVEALDVTNDEVRLPQPQRQSGFPRFCRYTSVNIGLPAPRVFSDGSTWRCAKISAIYTFLNIRPAMPASSRHGRPARRATNGGLASRLLLLSNLIGD